LQILALGPPEVYLGGNLVTFPTRKTLALLLYLAIEGGQQPRDHLASMFWPESSAELGYASLRNTLSRLQITLRDAGAPPEPPILATTSTTIGINPEMVADLDLRKVAQAFTLAKTERSNRSLSPKSNSRPILEEATALLRGEFLAGFSLGDAPIFDDWATMQREDWQRRLGLVLDRLSEIQFTQGEFSTAVETASDGYALDPIVRGAYRRKWHSVSQPQRG